MNVKTTIFAFVAAVIYMVVRALAAHADKDGNIYIKTPKELWREWKKKFNDFKACCKRVVKERKKS